MIPCISVENMRRSDAYTIANFVPGLELMRRAAMGVFKAYHWPGATAIVVGSGNNGGDGFALAWILKERGFDCTVFTVSQKMSPDSAWYAEKAREVGVPIRPFEKDCLTGYSTVVDCLLGTGFSGTVRGQLPGCHRGHQRIRFLRHQRGHQQRHEWRYRRSGAGRPV